VKFDQKLRIYFVHMAELGLRAMLESTRSALITQTSPVKKE